MRIKICCINITCRAKEKGYIPWRRSSTKKYPVGPSAKPATFEYVIPRSLMMLGWLSEARNSASRARSLQPRNKRKDIILAHHMSSFASQFQFRILLYSPCCIHILIWSILLKIFWLKMLHSISCIIGIPILFTLLHLKPHIQFLLTFVLILRIIICLFQSEG